MGREIRAFVFRYSHFTLPAFPPQEDLSLAVRLLEMEEEVMNWWLRLMTQAETCGVFHRKKGRRRKRRSQSYKKMGGWCGKTDCVDKAEW